MHSISFFSFLFLSSVLRILWRFSMTGCNHAKQNHKSHFREKKRFLSEMMAIACMPDPGAGGGESETTPYIQIMFLPSLVILPE